MTESNVDILYKKIKEEIINQSLKPGQHIPERELAEKHNVSRTPIRQVIQKLYTEGLVEFIPYKGAFIKDLSIEEFRDINEIRMILEKFAVEKCCEYIEDEMVMQIEEVINKQEIAIEQNDVKEYSLLDQEFHYLLVKAAGNKELERHCKILNHKSYLSRVRTLILPGRMEKSIVEHKKILECILDKDKLNAGETAYSHVSGALQTYINVHDIMIQLRY